MDATIESIKKESKSEDIKPPAGELFKKLDAPVIIEMNESHSSLMMDNPLETENYLITNRNNMSTAQDIVIRLKELVPLMPCTSLLSKPKFSDAGFVDRMNT